MSTCCKSFTVLACPYRTFKVYHTVVNSMVGDVSHKPTEMLVRVMVIISFISFKELCQSFHTLHLWYDSHVMPTEDSKWLKNKVLRNGNKCPILTWKIPSQHHHPLVQIDLISWSMLLEDQRLDIFKIHLERTNSSDIIWIIHSWPQDDEEIRTAGQVEKGDQMSFYDHIIQQCTGLQFFIWTAEDDQETERN